MLNPLRSRIFSPSEFPEWTFEDVGYYDYGTYDTFDVPSFEIPDYAMELSLDLSPAPIGIEGGDYSGGWW